MDQPERPIDVRVKLCELHRNTVQARLDRVADDARNEAVARPRIEAVLTSCKLALQRLEALHRRVAEVTNLDLDGYSRASAIWLLSGRTLGLLRALLVQVEAGICNEAVVTGRSIHEAARVLFAFGAPDTDDLVRLWLDDEGKHGYVKQPAARAAQERFEALLGEAMERAELPRIASTKQMTEELYDRQSRIVHNRRSSIVDQVWAPGREMAYGWHPSPIRRATYAKWAASMTTEVTDAVGDALRAFYGQGFFTREIVPVQQSIEAVRRSASLDEFAIRRAAGTA